CKMNVNYKPLDITNNIITGIIQSNHFCDYIGILSKHYIEFDAKETEKDYFDLANIKKHQDEKLRIIDNLGGIAFIIVYFHKYDQFFLFQPFKYTFQTKKVSYE